MNIQLQRDLYSKWSFPAGTVVKNLPTNARDVNLVPGSGTSSEGGNGNPLQYCYLKRSKDRGAWQATVHEVTKSGTYMSD